MLGLIGLLVGCGSSPPEMASSPDRFAEFAYDDGDYEMEDAPMAAEPEPTLGRGEGRARTASASAPAAPPPPAGRAAPTPRPAAAPDEPAEPERVREWFPEAFLWEPLVQTDEAGQASLQVTLPDQLTTWRVLALAHTREGAQAGSVHTFNTSLPLYVEPVVPGWLHAGDRLDLPVQVVNTTGEAVRADLRVQAEGALQGGGVAAFDLPGGASALRRLPVEASAAGEARVLAELRGADAAERVIPVVPAGRPVEQVRGGVLGAERRFTLAGPERADPATQELAVLVFPGPLAVLQSEMERTSASPGGSGAAYGFALAASLREVAAESGAELDPQALRRLELLSWQRVVPLLRSPGSGTATDLVAALAAVEDHPGVADTLPRLVRQLQSAQRADGTWARGGSTDLQQILVQTAIAGRALPEDALDARRRASGALERHVHRVEDPHTAAVLVASGLLPGDLVDGLRDKVIEGTTDLTDGRRTLGVLPTGTRGAWGHPSRAERLAFAVLALHEADVPWKGDLVAELMASYHARRGFGGGPADLYALEAVRHALPGLSREVEVVLSVGGQETMRVPLDPSHPRQPARLTARPGGGDAEVTLRVEPEVPGLGYVATLRSWVPWTGQERLPGVDVEVEPGRLVAGREGAVRVRMAAPAGVALTVEQPLPAGVAVDEDGLSRAGLARFEVHTDRVVLVTSPFTAGQVLDVRVPVTPTFSGRFQTGPVEVRTQGAARAAAKLAPVPWTVAPEG